jgi:hypothetical protein
MTLSSCGLEDEDDDSARGGSLDARSVGSNDFENFQVDEMDEMDARTAMRDFDWHENKATGTVSSAQLIGKQSRSKSFLARLQESLPKSLQLANTESNLLACTFGDSIIQSDGDRFWWEFTNPNFGECMKEELGSLITDATANMTMSGYFSKSCPGSDYSSLNGRKFTSFMAGSDTESTDDLDDIAPCDMANNNVQYQFKMIMSGTISGNVTSGGKTQPLNMSLATKDVSMSSTGGDCSFSSVDGLVTVNDCHHYDSLVRRTSSGDNEEITRELISATTTGMQGSGFGDFYESGELPIKVNDWTGKVTLDGTSRPWYELSKGSESFTGKSGKMSQD